MEKDEKIVKQRVMKKTLVEHVMIPQHASRKETPEFRKSKKKLKKDGHDKCWICGSKENLQVHHFCCEASLSELCDFDKLKEVCETFDIYGYGEQMKDIPMTSVDDIRNMMVLCRQHHIDYADGVKNGIHDITFPIWISQKICVKDGVDPVPDNADELEKIKQEIANRYKK